MSKNQFKLPALLLVVFSFTFLSFTPKPLPVKPEKPVFDPYLDRQIVIIANCHASFYRWTAVGFTGATSYAWSTSTDLSNWTSIGGSGSTCNQGGDASCDVVYVRCIGFVNGVHTYSVIVESDKCVPFDWQGPECPYIQKDKPGELKTALIKGRKIPVSFIQ